MVRGVIEKIKRKNKEGGFEFFSEGAIYFFSSRVHTKVYGGIYFVTSEKTPSSRRAYTVRRALEDGDIETVGEFMQYSTRQKAHAAAKRLADAHR